MSDFGQGGGFGPPGGGYGGPPSGGGGFGPPPSGGGGGFGPPPSGGGFGSPPGPSPGQGPLANIPFSADDEANLKGMARFAMFAGIAAIVAAFVQMVVSIIQAIVVDLPGQNPAGGVCGGVIGLGLAGLLAAFLFKASQAVKKVVETDDADQQNLVAALSSLKAYFMVKGILAIIVIVLVCCLVGVLVFAGAAIAGAMSNM